MLFNLFLIVASETPNFSDTFNMDSSLQSLTKSIESQSIRLLNTAAHVGELLIIAGVRGFEPPTT